MRPRRSLTRTTLRTGCLRLLDDLLRQHGLTLKHIYPCILSIAHGVRIAGPAKACRTTISKTEMGMQTN